MTEIPWDGHNYLLVIKDDLRTHDDAVDRCPICQGTARPYANPGLDVANGTDYMVWLASDPVPPWRRERVAA